MASIGMPISFIRMGNDPIDVSEVFKTTQERIDYLTNGTRYAGMIVYDYEADKHYRLSKDTNSWQELQGSGIEVYTNYSLLPNTDVDDKTIAYCEEDYTDDASSITYNKGFYEYKTGNGWNFINCSANSYDRVINWLKGKKINFMGDSITYGYIPASGGVQMDNPYPKLVGDILECTTNNYGISGSTLCNGTNGKYPIVDRINDMDKNSDVNVVFAGTNDWSHLIALGNIDSNDTTNIYGALNYIAEQLINNYPNSINVFCTLLKRGMVEGKYPIEQVNNAIVQVAKKYNFIVIDLYNNAPQFNPNVELLKNKWCSSTDSTHPNQDYISKIFAPYLAKRLMFLDNEYRVGTVISKTSGTNVDISDKFGVYNDMCTIEILSAFETDTHIDFTITAVLKKQQIPDNIGVRVISHEFTMNYPVQISSALVKQTRTYHACSAYMMTGCISIIPTAIVEIGDRMYFSGSINKEFINI